MAPPSSRATLFVRERVPLLRRHDRVGVLDLWRAGKAMTDERPPGLPVVGAAEVDGVVLERLPLDHQAIALRLLDRAVQRQALEATGTAENVARLADAGFELALNSGRDLDLGDLGDHGSSPRFARASIGQ